MTETVDKAKILIVDDVASNIHMLMETLKDDYAIVAAKNGAKALQLAETLPQPDLILLDVVMPEMNGHEVCKRLKMEPKTRDIPVIFVTALGEEADEATGLHLGAIDYIQKPFSQSIVRARIKNHLELVQARRKLQEQNQALLEAAALREDVERITRHDLKGPLNVVINGPQIMLMDPTIRDDQKPILQEITEAGYRMLDMINRSLDLYKMETGSYRLQTQEIDLLPMLAHVIAEHSNKFSDSPPIDIILDGKAIDLDGEDRVLVDGEELLCHSMFSNLLKNALEASPANRAVSIALRREADCVVVRIRNDGCVPETIRGRFFDKYVSAGKAHGTGLGTYSAALIARTLHGEISVDFSETGATSVIVRLPLTGAAPTDQAQVNAGIAEADLQEAAYTLPLECIEQLRQFVRQGDVSRMLGYLDTLQQDYPDLRLLKDIRGLGEQFKIVDLQRALEYMLKYA